nr:peptidylprolyl isomerase [Tissierella sp.]
MFNIKKKNLALVVVMLVLAMVVNGCTKKAPEGVAAIVNKEEIKKESLDKEYAIYKNLYINQLGEDVLEQVGPSGKVFKEELKDEVLTKLILEKVIFQDAKKEKIEVTDEEIDQTIETMKESMGGQEQLDEFLESVGMDEEYFRENTRRDILVQKHKANFVENFDLKDKEAEEFFNENKDKLIIIKAKHILVETEEKGKEILEALKNGGDFKKLAMENSQDANTSIVGGDLGYFSRGHNPEEFDKVVFDLEEGQLSPLIKTEIGFHIVEVEERKDTFEALKPELSGLIKENKYEEHIKKLEADADVEDFVTVKEEKKNIDIDEKEGKEDKDKKDK